MNNGKILVSQQNDEPQLCTQAELNDLVRELDLPKSSAELLGSRLKEKNMWVLKSKSVFIATGKKSHGILQNRRKFVVL